MRLIYQGKDITDDVEIESAVSRDTACGRCDSIDIAFNRSAAWYRWHPQPDDMIEIVQDGYSTGAMYLNTIYPEGDTYRILATGATTRAALKRYRSFRDMSFKEILELCAGECGMSAVLYGVDGGYRYPYLIRRNESCAAFLARLCRYEGAVLKTMNGAFTVISVERAEQIPSNATITVAADQQGADYIRRDNLKRGSLTVKTPYLTVTAWDDSAAGSDGMTLTQIPVTDAATAGRWARGLLRMNNRRAEELILSSEFNAGWTAMARFDIDGGTDADGEWLIDEVTHDYINMRSTAVFRRRTGAVR